MKQKSKYSLSLVIPCFNESENVLKILDQLKILFEESDEFLEAIFVDGGSKDETVSLAQEKIKSLNLSSVQILSMPKRGGYGCDIMQGLERAKGNVLAWTHADLQTDPRDVVEGLKLYKEHGEKTFIKGERKGRSFLDVFFTFGMQIFSFLVLGVYLSDINAQPKLFSRNFYEKYLKKNPPSDFSLDLFALYSAKKKHFQIKTFPVFFKKRIFGEAKGGGGSFKNKFNLIKRTARYILALKIR